MSDTVLINIVESLIGHFALHVVSLEQCFLFVLKIMHVNCSKFGEKVKYKTTF